MHSMRIFLTLVAFLTLSEASFPICVSTWDNIDANIVAWKNLKEQNGTALSSVVLGVEFCELSGCTGVGFNGGKTDEDGEATLDALIVDGVTIKSGGVAGLRYIKQAIRTAYFVLTNTYHTLISGDLATDFAVEMGLYSQGLSTSKSIIGWENWKGDKCQRNYRRNVAPNPLENCGPYYRIPYDPNDLNPPQYGPNPFAFDPANSQITPSSDVKFDPSRITRDSIGLICIDGKGNVAAGVSTNGANRKIPGRVGDNAVPGAAAHAQNNAGAAVTTGVGDYMINFSPSNTAINYLEAGLTPLEAAKKVIDKINAWYPNMQAGIVVVSITGEVGAACSGIGELSYTVIDESQCDESAVVNRVTCELYPRETPPVCA